MEPMVISLGGRGRAIRVRQPAIGRRRLFGPIPRSSRLDRDPCCSALSRSSPRSGRLERGSGVRDAVSPAIAADPSSQGAAQPRYTSPAFRRGHRLARSARSQLPHTGTPAAEASPQANQRFKVRDEYGNCVVARFHGQDGDKTALILPDGQLGFANRLVPTDEPFQPLTADQLETVLREGPFAEYHLLKTDHYLIFYKSTPGLRAETAGVCSMTSTRV